MITVVIPVRSNPELEDADTTLWSLQYSTYKDFVVVIVPDQGRGANWARNFGASMAKTEYILFSDNDITWHSYAIETLLDTLEDNPDASYAYGSWKDQRGEFCYDEFSAEQLKKNNFISTMSLIRTQDFVDCGGFDENIKRLQDWDLWLNLLINHNKVGVQCSKRIFETVTDPDGITNNSKEDYQQAKQIIKKKYGI